MSYKIFKPSTNKSINLNSINEEIELLGLKLKNIKFPDIKDYNQSNHNDWFEKFKKQLSLFSSASGVGKSLYQSKFDEEYNKFKDLAKSAKIDLKYNTSNAKTDKNKELEIEKNIRKFLFNVIL